MPSQPPHAYFAASTPHRTTGREDITARIHDSPSTNVAAYVQSSERDTRYHTNNATRPARHRGANMHTCMQSYSQRVFIGYHRVGPRFPSLQSALRSAAPSRWPEKALPTINIMTRVCRHHMHSTCRQRAAGVAGTQYSVGCVHRNRR